jgi:hypothetical protein
MLLAPSMWWPTETAVEVLTKLLIDTDEANLTNVLSDIELPPIIEPYTLISLPMRAKLLVESDDPICIKPMTEAHMIEPDRVMPNTDNDDPALTAARTEIADPTWHCCTILALCPILAKERMDMDDPVSVWPMILMCPIMTLSLPTPAIDIPLPNLAKVLKDIELPARTKSYTDAEEPRRM